MEALVDNDILLKGVCYGLLDDLFSLNVTSIGMLGILGAARFVVTKKIRRRALTHDEESAIKSLEDFIQRVTVVEPTSDEQCLAAEFELAAQRAGVALDIGESQLCAVLIVRAVRQLYTGDKRAIHAMQELLEVDTRLRPLCGKVNCLEQLVLQSITEGNVARFRASVCAEPKIDLALTICFSCSSRDVPLEDICYALNSYINDLRKDARQILAS
jgi:hypothetical protein